MKKSNTFVSPSTILAVTKSKTKSYPGLPLIFCIPMVAPSSDQCQETRLHHQVLESSARVHQKRFHRLESFCSRLILVIHIKHNI